MKKSKGEDLIEEFGLDCEAWGWQQDQGCGSGVALAENHHADSLAKITKYVTGLESKLKKARKAIKESKISHV